MFVFNRQSLVAGCPQFRNRIVTYFCKKRKWFFLFSIKMRQKSLFDGTSVSIFCFFCTRPDLSAEKSFLFMSILSKGLHPTIGLCVRTFLNNAFSVQHGLFQGVAVIHQLEGKVGVLLPPADGKRACPPPRWAVFAPQTFAPTAIRPRRRHRPLSSRPPTGRRCTGG